MTKEIRAEMAALQLLAHQHRAVRVGARDS